MPQVAGGSNGQRYSVGSSRSVHSAHTSETRSPTDRQRSGGDRRATGQSSPRLPVPLGSTAASVEKNNDHNISCCFTSAENTPQLGRCLCCHFVAEHPAVTSIASLFFIGLFVLIGLTTATLGIETTFIEDQDVVASTSVRERRAFDAALQMRLPGVRLFKHYDVVVAYEWESGTAINQDALAQVVAFEQRIRSLPQWQSLCAKTDPAFRQLCEVGLSYASYALAEHQPPGGSVVPQALAYNGIGTDMLPLPPLRQILRRHDLLEVLLPASSAHSTESQPVAIRSIFRFRFFCCESNDTVSAQEGTLGALKQEFQSFMQDALLPVLRRPEVPMETGPLHVWFTLPLIGAELEVDSDVIADVDQAVVGSLFVVLLCMLIHTRNLVISLAGMSLLILSPLFAYAIVGIFIGHRLNVVSLVSLFPSLGLGVDTLLLYTDAWQEAVERRGTEADCLKLTWNNAAWGSLCSALISSFTFIAMLPASNAPMREVVVFLFVVIMLQWTMMTMIYVPLCALDERFCVNYRCGRLCRNDPARSPAARRKLASTWESFVRKWRIPCIGAFSVAFLACFTCTVIFVRIEDGVPLILPEYHNQNRGRATLAKFRELSSVLRDEFRPPPATENVCSEQAFSTAGFVCSLFWCDALPKAWLAQGTPEEYNCQCFQDTQTGVCHDLPANVTVVQRFVGLSPTQLKLGGATSWYLMVSQNVVEELPLQRLQPLILQEWATGSMQIEPVTQATTKIAGDATKRCDWRNLCYCGGSSRCIVGNGWNSVPPLIPPDAVIAARDDNRWAQEGSITLGSNTGTPRVQVIAGFTANVNDVMAELGSLWGVSGEFNPTDLWAQRALFGLFDDVSKDVKIVRSTCWLLEFKPWIISHKNGRFPVPHSTFYSLVSEFLAQPNYSHFADFMWFRDGKVVAWYAEFDADLPVHPTDSEVLTYKQSWDGYIQKWIDSAPGAAKAVWHTSVLWSHAHEQAGEAASLSGLLVSIVFAGIVAVFGTSASNWPGVIGALSAGLAVLLSYFAMFFIVAVLIDSKIGFIEVVGIVVVLVQCVSYCVHLVLCGSRVGGSDCADQNDDYMQHCDRTRTNVALSSMGAATVSSCFVVVGCSAFLALGHLPVFRTMGTTAIIGAPVTVIVVLIFFLALLELVPQTPTDDPSMPKQRIQQPEPLERSGADVKNFIAAETTPTTREDSGMTRSPPSDDELAVERVEQPTPPTPIATEVVLKHPHQTQHVLGRSETRKVTRAMTLASSLGGSKSNSRKNTNQWESALL